MVTVTGFMNLYQSGFYHRRGKPGDINVHGGDVYLTRKAALASIAGAGYMATIQIQYVGHEYPLANPPESEPTKLSITRAQIASGVAGWMYQTNPGPHPLMSEVE